MIQKKTFSTICLTALLLAFATAPKPVPAIEIKFRSFSGAAAIGPPADEYAAKLESITKTVFGDDGKVTFTKISPRPAVPREFGGNIIAAVGAGGDLAGENGFDAAYASGSSLNKVWGFLFNSGVPFGPNYDEFLGFLYGKSVNGGNESGLDLLQKTLDQRKRNVIAIPIVGSTQQGSGYFMKPVGSAGSTSGIGLSGLCMQDWTFRYLPPAQYVLDLACDNLVAKGAIEKKNIKFVTAVAGGKIIQNIIDGKVQAFEFATPLDDMSVLFSRPEGNPGTVGARFLHYPGWHQPFLITYLIINKKVWNMLNSAQQTLVMSVARDHVSSSYGENLRQQGGKLQEILSANRDDKDEKNDIVLVRWPDKDLEILRDATIQFLNARVDDKSLDAEDRQDYGKILKAFREYVSQNNGYWKRRDIPSAFRFIEWTDSKGKESWDQRFK